MDAEEEKKIVEEILKDRRLPYSIEILDVEGDKYTIRNNFGSTITYSKKGENYNLE
ncbi:MAG: hypothetical protein ACXACC_07585 [Promethearchaeota archaeon]|jgi:hypothetical protein